MAEICYQILLKACLIKYLLALLVLLKSIYCQTSTNLIVNGDFSINSLGWGKLAYFTPPITGWNCTTKCQIINCARNNAYWIALGSYGANCTGFVVDTISDHQQNVTQNVVLEEEFYNLSLNYYYPRSNANWKTFQVYFNKIKVFSFTPNVSVHYIPQYLETKVQGNVGVNTLRLTTIRNQGTDFDGFTVNNVILTKMANHLQQFLNNTILSNFTLIMAKIPGSRVICGDFMKFFVNLDRLQFYYFHNRNYSKYSTVLLTNINILNDLKGLFFQTILQQFNPHLSNYIDSFFSSIDYKYNYTSITILGRDSNGRGFVKNCYSFFVYTMPGTVITYIVFFILFNILRKRQASRLTRKYSLLGMLMVMIFEGNIEWLTYYSIGEMTLFFSAGFRHRLINVFITVFQFIITIVAVGSVLFFKYHYRRLIFYFIEDKRNNYMGILCQTVDSGVICLLFGIVHQILFSKPQLQLFFLLSLEFCWVLFKACLISKKAYKKNFVQSIMFITGLVRMCLIITFYFYEFADQMRNLINNQIHRMLVIFFLFLWSLELLAAFFYFISSIPNFFAKLAVPQIRPKLHLQKGKTVQFDGALRKIQRKIQENLIKTKNRTEKQSFLKGRHTSSNIRVKKGRSFQHQKILITQLRINRLMSNNYNIGN